MLRRSSKARISFSQWNISSSCSGASLNFVRLIGGIGPYQITRFPDYSIDGFYHRLSRVHGVGPQASAPLAPQDPDHLFLRQLTAIRPVGRQRVELVGDAQN